MDLSKITTSTLEALVKLTKKRDTIIKELRRIEAAITGAYSGRKSEPSTGRRRRGRGRRRSLPRCNSSEQAFRSSGGRRQTRRTEGPHPHGLACCRRQRCRCERALFEARCEKSKRSCLVQQHRQEAWNDSAYWSRTLSAQTGRVSPISPRNSSEAFRFVRQVP